MTLKMSWISCRVKDPFPALSHWAGAVLSVVGCAVLMVLARGRPWHVVAFGVYGVTLVLLYSASGLAHTVFCGPGAGEWLTRADCMAIFLLIAGTYTPFCLTALRGPWGWGMLAAEWGMAAVGIVLVATGRARAVVWRTLLYLVMAWVVALVAIGPMLHRLGGPTLAWLGAGGVAYSIGSVVFATDRPTLWAGRFVAHDLWHVLVLVGSGCHFAAVARLA